MHYYHAFIIRFINILVHDAAPLVYMVYMYLKQSTTEWLLTKEEVFVKLFYCESTRTSTIYVIPNENHIQIE